MISHNRVRELKGAKREDCAKIVEALSQVTMCVVEKVEKAEKQSILTMWDKIERWSP